MENKSNEATHQRPEGDRFLNAPLIEMDLNKLMQQVRNEQTWKESDRNSITILKSDQMRIVLIGLHKAAELKTHSASGVISVQVLEGKINFTAAQQTLSLVKGQMLALQENIPHSVLASEESFFLLTLSMTRS